MPTPKQMNKAIGEWRGGRISTADLKMLAKLPNRRIGGKSYYPYASYASRGAALNRASAIRNTGRLAQVVEDKHRATTGKPFVVYMR